MEELRDALDAAREKGDRAAEASALYGIGQIYFKEKVWEAALDFWSQCERICREENRSGEWLQVAADLGDLATAQERWDQAQEWYQEALARAEETGAVQVLARIWDRVGSLALKLNRPGAALGAFSRGESLCRAGGDRIGRLYFLEQMIPILKSADAEERLEEALRQAITLAEALGDRERMALWLVALADHHLRAGRAGEAEPLLALAHDRYVAVGKTDEANLVKNQLLRLGWRPPNDEEAASS
jgi:tetratricopeptide (TPR) repeat protein